MANGGCALGVGLLYAYVGLRRHEVDVGPEQGHGAAALNHRGGSSLVLVAVLLPGYQLLRLYLVCDVARTAITRGYSSLHWRKIKGMS